MKRIDTMSIREILRQHHDLCLPRAEIAVASVLFYKLLANCFVL